MKKLFFFVISLTTLFLACRQSSEKADVATPEPSKKYTLTAFTASTLYNDAAIESMNYTDGKFSFGIGGESYKLGVQTPDAPQKMCANSAEGQHIHLIDGPRPYVAKYTSDFDHDMEDGKHYLLAFLSRSYHESIKTNAAHAAQIVDIKNKSITSTEDITKPMIFYSRPKGTYVGDDTKKLMLDFYLVNCDLGEKFSVKAEINGEVHMIDKWQPYYIEGLPMGENTIRLTLLYKDGNTVVAPHNPVQRTFNLVAEPEM